MGWSFPAQAGIPSQLSETTTLHRINDEAFQADLKLEALEICMATVFRAQNIPRPLIKILVRV